MFGMALTRPRHWQMGQWHGRLRACVRAKGRLRSTIFSHMTRDVSVFVKCVTIFRFFFKLPQFHTSNFRKVVRQHTEGVVGSTTLVLLEMYLAFQQWKNFENPLRIDKVIAMSSVCSFFGPPCIYGLDEHISAKFCGQMYNCNMHPHLTLWPGSLWTH